MTRYVMGWGWVVLCPLILMTGCGLSRHTGGTLAPTPRSTVEIAELTAYRALSSAEIPDGGGSQVHVIVEGDSSSFALWRVVAPRFITAAGYRIASSDVKDGAGGSITVRADTLSAVIEIRSSFLSPAVAKRRVEARVTVLIRGPRGDVTVHDGTAAWRDSVHPAVVAGESRATWSTVRTIPSAHEGWIKAFLVAGTMSLMAWSLYLYRG